MLEEHLAPYRKNYESFMSDGSYSDADKQQAASDFEMAMQKMRASIDRLEADGNRAVTDSLAESINQTVGILSLTSEPASLLMWSHYADSHRGIAVGMDSESAFFHLPDPLRRQTPIHEVQYAKEQTKTVSQLSEEYQACLLTKSKDWAYEREFRVMRVLTSGYEIGGKDAEGHGIYLFSYPKEAVVEVIFGLRCSDKCQARVRAALARHGMESVRLRMVHQSHLSFDVEIRDAS